MARWGVLWLFVVSGCDVIFKLNGPVVGDAAGDAPDVGLPRGCSRTSLFTQDFQGGLDSWFSINPGGTNNQVAIAIQRLTFDMNEPGRTEVEVAPYLDLRDDNFTFSTGPTAGTLMGNRALFELRSQAGDDFRLVFEVADDGTLEAYYVEADQQMAIGSVPYDSVQQRIWRISNADGRTIWETSPDGAAFTELGSSSALTWLSFVQPMFIAERTSTGGSFQLSIDDINRDPRDTEVCPADALRDRFTETAIQERWGRTIIAGCRFDIIDEQLVATFTNDGGNQCELGGSTAYDLRDHPFTIEVPSVMLTTQSETAFLRITTRTGATAELNLRDGMLRAQSSEEITPYRSAPYDPTTHRWWRIVADAAGRVTWLVSSDGVMFTEFANTLELVNLGLDQVLVRFGIEAGGDGLGTVTFDNVNTGP